MPSRVGGLNTENKTIHIILEFKKGMELMKIEILIKKCVNYLA